MHLIISCAGQVPFSEETLLHREDSVSFRESVGINAKSSRANNEDNSNGKFSPALNGEDEVCRKRHTGHSIHEGDGSPTSSSSEPVGGRHARAISDGLDNGYLDRKSSKEDKWKHGELGCLKGSEKLKGDYDNEDLEVNGGKASSHKKNSSSESGGGKHRTLRSSPSNHRYRSRSRSSGHTYSIIDEYTHSKRRNPEEHGTHSYAGRQKTDYDPDEERMVECGRERGHVSKDLVVDDGREWSSSFHSREARDRGRSKDRIGDRDLIREKERERSRNREADRVHRREKERERSYERDRRDVERDRSRGREVDRDRRRERDRSWDVVERGRREKERERSWDRTRAGERDRVRVSERDDKYRERDKIKERERERRDDRYRHKDRDTLDKDRHMGYEDGKDSRDRYRNSRHARHEEKEDHWERRRNSDTGKDDNSMGTALEGGENKLERYSYFSSIKILYRDKFFVCIYLFLLFFFS